MYIVSGATGQTGSVVAKTLLEKKLPVRVIVRSEEKGKACKELGAEVAVADARDAEALKKALEGGKALYLMNPPIYHSKDMLIETDKVIEAFQAAIESAQLEKLVILSSVGAHLSEGTGVILTLHRLEKALANSRVPTTILRPVSFMENWNFSLDAVKNQGVLPSFHQPLDQKFHQIAAQDVGRVAAESLTEKTQGVEIKELEGISVSPDETAEAFGKVLGKKVQAVAIPEDQWLDIFKGFCSPKNAAAMVEMNKGLNSGIIRFETDDRLKGKVTIDEFAREILGQNAIGRERTA